MADENTIIEGTVKFRDGKKWKSRWCVMRRLSPVADCVQAQLYRDAGARRAGASCKAALALRRLLACESGFTLDKHSHTLALLCRDLALVLAFDSRERLMQWQVKLSAALGATRAHAVVVRAGGRRAGGPARLHVRGRRFALVAGAPPRLLGAWDLPHLRRYGIVDGRFCFEGGSLCGEGEGLHVLAADRPDEILRDFDRASEDRSSPEMHPIDSGRAGGTSVGSESHMRLPELDTTPAAPGSRAAAEDASPCWPSAERTHAQDLELGDATSLGGGCEPWAGGVALQRCASCMSKLGGALSRSSTAPLTPGAAHFSPAWTMEPVSEVAAGAPSLAAPSGSSADVGPPWRPPKPTGLELNLSGKPPMPPPLRTCNCPRGSSGVERSGGAGPYENYDVPKLPSAEVDGEYYDTPKRLKESMSDDLFRLTKNSLPNAVILKKPCGCLLKFGTQRTGPTIVDCEEDFRSPNCPCRRVTDWAHDWIRLPYCRKSTLSSDDLALHDGPAPRGDGRSALYATVDPSRKTRRKQRADGPAGGRGLEVDDGPLANYENLSFALSLEHYENAKDLLRKVGVTQSELDAIGANLRAVSLEAASDEQACGSCGRTRLERTARPHDDYLTMRPGAGERAHRAGPPPAGYAPMSPVGTYVLDVLSPVDALAGKAPGDRPAAARVTGRAGSADSSRSGEDGDEFAGDGRGSASSADTLRAAGPAPGARAAPAAGNRDSSSSNDSGVSSWSLRRGRGFELPPTTAAARRSWRSAHRAPAPCPPARRARSSDPPRLARVPPAPTSCSAEAEIPVLSAEPLRVLDAHSTSSGTSDMSDFVETLSMCSSQSSADAPEATRLPRQTTSTLRPRSGAEYRNVGPRLGAAPARGLRPARGAPDPRPHAAATCRVPK